MAVFAGVRGYLDGIEVADVTRFEEGLMSQVRAQHADILESIRTERELSDDTEGKLAAVVEAFAKTFA